MVLCSLDRDTFHLWLPELSFRVGGKIDQQQRSLMRGCGFDCGGGGFPYNVLTSQSFVVKNIPFNVVSANLDICD